MTVKHALGRARDLLMAGHIEEAELEAELLLKHALGLDRVGLYLQLDRECTAAENDRFWHLIDRRLRHEPTAYIIGYREFFGLDFEVNSSVLIPRPETELLVEKTLALAQERGINTIADIGTGCGAIAIALSVHLQETRIYACEISEAAITVARANAWKHGVAGKIAFLTGDMLEPLPVPVDVIIANLPYVKKSELPVSGFEPVLALDGGIDGLDQIRRLCSQVDAKLNPGGHLLLEIGQSQSQAVAALLRSVFHSSSIEITPDLAGIDRVVSMKLQSESAAVHMG